MSFHCILKLHFTLIVRQLRGERIELSKWLTVKTILPINRLQKWLNNPFASQLTIADWEATWANFIGKWLIITGTHLVLTTKCKDFYSGRARRHDVRLSRPCILQCCLLTNTDYGSVALLSHDKACREKKPEQFGFVMMIWSDCIVVVHRNNQQIIVITFLVKTKTFWHKHAIQHNNIARIRCSLTEDAAATLVNSQITSRLDSFNSILYGIPDYLMYKLQLVQNNAARLVIGTRSQDHITPVLKHLHWLPVSFRIDYKITLLCFKALNNLAPQYLTDLLIPYKQNRDLRSCNKAQLEKPITKGKEYGDRAFSYAAPT